MTPENKIDFQSWNRQLDAGDRSDPLVELAHEIKELVPGYAGPSEEFQEQLQLRLQNQFHNTPVRLNLPRRRFIALGLAVLVLLVVAIVALWPSQGSLPDASAAEILELAGQNLSESLAGGELLYDRWILDWHKGGFQEKGVIAELWRSADDSHRRFQMVNDRGKLLYFDQRADDTVWRSSYVHVESGKEVDFVYQAPYMPPIESLEDQQLLAHLLMRDFGNFWILIDQLAGSERSGCAQLFCVLGSLGNGWDCSGANCILNLGPVLGTEDFIVKAQTDRMEWLPNSRQVYQVRLHLSAAPENYFHILKFDTETYDLLEIEKYRRGDLTYSIRLEDRQIISGTDLLPDFFESIPEGVEVRPWPGDAPIGHYEDDKVWIISADPPPGTELDGIVSAHVEIGYQLTSVEKAAIKIGHLYWSGQDTGVKLDVESVPVLAGEGTIGIDFVIDTTDLGDGRWSITPGFIDVLGINPGVGWGFSPSGIYLEWCVRCTPPSPGPTPINSTNIKPPRF